MALDASLKKPFAEQVDYFRQKLNLPTERWDDLAGAAHDRAFVVAGAQAADLLANLRAAVGAAIKDGKSLDAFRKEFEAIVARNGWTGWTGEGSQAGVAWRTRVIYQTNMATSYAAGRWAQLNDPELVALRPYWRYVHSELVSNPRPQHQAWNGLVLHKDDPFWRTHYPPNGWGCQCSVKAASRADVAAARAKGLDAAPEGWDQVDQTTGTPPGIDKGWGHAPGATWHPDLDKYDYHLARQVVARNMRDGVFERWHARLAQQVTDQLADPELAALDKSAQINVLRKRLAVGEVYPVAVLPPPIAAAMRVTTQVVNVSGYDLVKQQVSRAGQDFGAVEYLQAQLAIESPRLLVAENDQMTLFLSDAAGEWYAAVLQRTASGKGVFLKSYRRSNERDVKLQRKKGSVLIDTLAG